MPQLVGTDVETKLREAMEEGRGRRFEYYDDHQDRWLEVRLHPTRAGLDVYFTDISVRQAVLDSITDAFFTLDREGRVTYANSAAREDFGRPLGDLLGRDFRQLLPQAAGSSFHDHYLHCLESGSDDSFATLHQPSGEWTEVHLYPTPDGVAVLYQNVTERRRHEDEQRAQAEALRRSEAKARHSLARATLLADLAGAALRASDLADLTRRSLELATLHLGLVAGKVFTLDGTGTELTAIAVTGYPESMAREFERMPVDDGTYEGQLVAERLPYLTSDSGRTAAESERRMRVGGWEESRWAALPLIAGDRFAGALMLVFPGSQPFDTDELALCRALADQLGAAMERERLRAAGVDDRRRLLALLEHSSLCAAYLSPGLTYLYANGSYAALAGATPEELVGRQHFAVFPATTARPVFEQVLETNRVYVEEARAAAGPDGETRYWDWRLVPVTDGRGGLDGLLVLSQDVTGRVRRQQLGDALNDIAEALTSLKGPEEVLATVVRLAGQAFGADAANIALRREHTWVATHVWNMPVSFVGQSWAPDAVPYAEEAIQSQQPVPLDDYRNDPRAYRPLVDELDVSATMAVPLIIRRRSVGALFLTYYGRPHRFTEDEVEFGRRAGAIVSQVLQNARLAERQRERARLSDSLLRVEHWLATARDQEQLLRRAARLGRAVLRCDSALTALREGKTWRVTSSLGFPSGDEADVLAAVDVPAATGASDGTTAPGARSALVAPLTGRGRPTGLVAFHMHDTRRRFSDAEKDFVRRFADSVSLALEGLRLDAEIEAEAAERLHQLRLREALAEVAEALSGTLDEDELFVRLLGESAAALEAESAVIDLIDHDALVPRFVYGLPMHDLGRPTAASEVPTLWRVAHGDVPLAVDDCTADETLCRGIDPALRVRSLLAIPLHSGSRPLGVLAFQYHAAARRFTASELGFAAEIGALASEAVKSARLYQEAQRARAFSEALNEISALVGGTFELGEALAKVVARTMSAVHADSGSIRRLRDEHWTLVADPAERDAMLPRAVERELTELARDSRETIVLVAEQLSRRAQRFLEELGLGTIAAVPLSAGDEAPTLLLLGRSGPRFTEEEIRFLASVGTAARAALQNARLYEQERYAAQTLQQALLRPLPRIDGLEIATDMSTAHRPDLVGGDFFAAFTLPDGRAALLIGDVQGKGIRAAGLTETVRSSVHALLLAGHTPAQVLDHVNESLLSRKAEQFVTALLLVLDPVSGEIVYAGAGHPAPIVAGPGAPAFLPVEGAAPLGSFMWTYEERSWLLSPGALLVLYTDGLTEARRASELYGDDRLLATVQDNLSASPVDIVAALRASAEDFADRLRDDLQVVALRLQPQGVPVSSGRG